MYDTSVHSEENPMALVVDDEPGGAVRGIIQNKAGDRIEGAECLYWPGGPEFYSDKNGEFIVLGLPREGNVCIDISKFPEYKGEQVNVEMKGTETIDIGVVTLEEKD
jgi:hypothetical protein